MRAFKQDTFARLALFVQHFPDGGGVWQNLGRDFQQRLFQTRRINRLQPQPLAQGVVVGQQTFDAQIQRGFVRQIGHADHTATHLVLVTGTNTATCGADFGNRILAFPRAVQFAVDRQDQRGIFRDHQVFGGNFHPLPAQFFHFGDKGPGVQHHAVADHRQLAFAQQARGQHR